MDLVTNSKQPIQTTIFRVTLTMKTMCWCQKISVFCLSPKCHSFKKKLGKGTVPKTNVALENWWWENYISFYFQGVPRLLCWCCHATATAPIPPKSHPLSFLDLSVSGVACRLHTQKRLQVCGYTTGIMEGNAKHSTTYHNFRYCSYFASSSSQFCTTSH